MSKNKPNILLVMSDQHRFDCLGIYGNQDIQTTNIDQLGEDGIVFDNSFSAAPSCTPSRYSMLTGLYPHQHQGYTNYSTIPAGTETFPQLLKESGYKTKVVGKMHLTPTYLDVGFDEMELAEQTPPGRYEDDYHWFLKENNLINEVDLIDQVDEIRKHGAEEYWNNFGAVVSNLSKEFDSTNWIAEKALGSINEWQGDANFLMTSFIKPHHPFDPPEPWDKLYDPHKLSLLPGWTDHCLADDLKVHEGFFPHEKLSKDVLRKVMAYYYANISHIDFQIGRMIELLKQKNMYDNTLIVYTSDHGEYMGFHHMLLKGNNLYDPLAKVPLIIKYPNKVQNGTRSNMLVNNIDIAPTLLRAAGAKIGKFMSGIDLSQENDQSQYVFAENGRGRQYMVRSKEYKLLWGKKVSQRMFFDLKKDPLEVNNVYGNPIYKDAIDRHKEALFNMVLIEAPSPVHLDERALCIKSAKARKSLMEWNKEKISSSHLIE